MISNPKSRRNEIVGTTNRSIAAMPSAWLCKNVFQPCDGGSRLLTIYLATLVCPISMPSLRSSPWIPRRSPQRIGNAHLADKLAYLRRYNWPATTAPRLPPPIRSEPGAVPFNHGLRLHDRQGAQHLRSQTIQAGEYQTVQHPERRPFRRLPPQHVKLMTQNRVFSLKRDPRPERSDQRQPN